MYAPPKFPVFFFCRSLHARAHLLQLVLFFLVVVAHGSSRRVIFRSGDPVMSGDVSVSLSRFDSVDAITFYSETSPDETLIVVIASESNEEGGQCGPTLLPHVLYVSCCCSTTRPCVVSIKRDDTNSDIIDYFTSIVFHYVHSSTLQHGLTRVQLFCILCMGRCQCSCQPRI